MGELWWVSGWTLREDGSDYRNLCASVLSGSKIILIQQGIFSNLSITCYPLTEILSVAVRIKSKVLIITQKAVHGLTGPHLLLYCILLLIPVLSPLRCPWTCKLPPFSSSLSVLCPLPTGPSSIPQLFLYLLASPHSSSHIASFCAHFTDDGLSQFLYLIILLSFFHKTHLCRWWCVALFVFLSVSLSH